MEEKREQLAMIVENEKLNGIDLDELRTTLEGLGFIAPQVSAAIDLFQNGREDILRNYRDYKDNPEDLLAIMEQTTEGHVEDFTPQGWVEPIKVSGGVSQRMIKHVGKLLFNTLK